LMKLDNLFLNDFSICEQLFKYRHIDCQRLKGGRSWYSTFGIWWAHVLEDIYKETGSRQEAGLGPPEKGDFIAAAVRWWLKDDMDHFALVAPKQYQAFAVGYVSVNINQRQFKMPVGAVNIAAQYNDYYTRMRDFENWRIIATESTFGLKQDVIVGENDEVVVAYQGRPDIVGFDKGKQLLEPADNKTTAKIDGDFSEDWDTNPQIKGYVVAVRELAKQLNLKISEPVNSCLINGAARDEPSKNPKDGIVKQRFTRIRVKFDDELLDEWRHDLVAKASRLRHCIEHNEWIWRTSACNYQYGHPCEYRSVDSLTPANRPLLFKSHYTIVEPWSPQIVGERKEQSV